MNNELFETLEKKVEYLLDEYTALKQEVFQLREENQRLLKERGGFKDRVDAMIKKLEGL